MEVSPTEVCEYLSFHVSAEYGLLRFHNCAYSESTDVLTTVFLYDDSITEKLDTLKPRLELEYKKLVPVDLTHSFKYEKSYIDEIMLKLNVKKFLTTNFSILTLNLTEDDITVQKTNSMEISAHSSFEGFSTTIALEPQTLEYVRQNKLWQNYVTELHNNHFCTFAFHFTVKHVTETEHENTAELLDQYMNNQLSETETRVDKTIKIKGLEYWLGTPIKQKPIKAEFLKINSTDEQVTAGTITFLTKREYVKKAGSGEGESKPYYTFVLDDGNGGKVQYIHFPTAKTLDKFEKLTNSTAICVIGINSERNGRVGFNVRGVSFCEMV